MILFYNLLANYIYLLLAVWIINFFIQPRLYPYRLDLFWYIRLHFVYQKLLNCKFWRDNVEYFLFCFYGCVIKRANVCEPPQIDWDLSKNKNFVDIFVWVEKSVFIKKIPVRLKPEIYFVQHIYLRGFFSLLIYSRKKTNCPNLALDVIRRRRSEMGWGMDNKYNKKQEH